MGKILAVVLSVLLILGAPVWAASKEDLQGIKEQASLKEKQLKEYQNKQRKLEEELKNLTRREEQTGKKHERIKDSLTEVKSKSADLKSRQEIIQSTLPMWQTLMQETLTSTIIENMLESNLYSGDTLMRNILLNSLLKIKTIYFKNLQK